jgi:hypothetical protein
MGIFEAKRWRKVNAIAASASLDIPQLVCIFGDWRGYLEIDVIV